MRRMTCKQLGGPINCNKEFHAETWGDMKQQSMNHGHEMFQKGDKDHLNAMNKMKDKMKNPNAMKEWMENKEKEFDALAESS